MKTIKEQKRRRPPDVLNAVVNSYALDVLREVNPSNDALHIPVFLSGNQLKSRMMQFCSGSRTTKKRLART